MQEFIKIQDVLIRTSSIDAVIRNRYSGDDGTHMQLDINGAMEFFHFPSEEDCALAYEYIIKAIGAEQYAEPPYAWYLLKVDNEFKEDGAIGTRIVNACHRLGIKTLFDLYKTPRSELMKQYTIGVLCITRIMCHFQKYGAEW